MRNGLFFFILFIIKVWSFHFQAFLEVCLILQTVQTGNLRGERARQAGEFSGWKSTANVIVACSVLCTCTSMDV